MLLALIFVVALGTYIGVRPEPRATEPGVPAVPVQTTAPHPATTGTTRATSTASTGAPPGGSAATSSADAGAAGGPLPGSGPATVTTNGPSGLSPAGR